MMKIHTNHGASSGSILQANAIKVKDLELSPTSSLEKQNILTISNLQLATPANKRVLVQKVNLLLPERSNLLITGLSGPASCHCFATLLGFG